MLKKGNKINTRRKMTEETKKKIGDSNRGQKRSGKELDRIRKLCIGNTGEKSGNWKGGITYNANKYHRDRYSKLSEEQQKKESWNKNKRNRMKRSNGGFHNFGEWQNLKAQYNWTCPCCEKSEPSIKLTEDHIIPVSKGGSDNIENIQPLCQACNTRKKDTTIKY